MTPVTSPTAARTSDSSDRNVALAVLRASPAHQSKTTGRFGQTARRFLTALMRSLAAPHV
jgi:hypothetical protein